MFATICYASLQFPIQFIFVMIIEKKMKKMNNEYKINKEKEQNNHMKNFAFLMLFFVECFCGIEKKVFNCLRKWLFTDNYWFLCIGRPDSPRNVEVTCDVKRATLKWQSSFNGGDPQTFTAYAVNGHQSTHSYPVLDRGENRIHQTLLQNLQPSLTYVFYVSTKNRHGNRSSDVKSCTTLEGIC